MDKEQIIAELSRIERLLLEYEMNANILSANCDDMGNRLYYIGSMASYNTSSTLLTNLIKRIENDSE